MRDNPEQDHEIITKDIRLILNRIVRFLRPIIFFQIDSVIESSESVEYLPLATEVKQKFVLLETLSSAKTLDYDRLIEVVPTDWASILKLIWDKNETVIGPIVKRKLRKKVDEKLKVVYPRPCCPWLSSGFFYNMLGNFIDLVDPIDLHKFIDADVSNNKDCIKKKTSKYTVWYKDSKMNFCRTDGNVVNQYSLSLSSETEEFG